MQADIPIIVFKKKEDITKFNQFIKATKIDPKSYFFLGERIYTTYKYELLGATYRCLNTKGRNVCPLVVKFNLEEHTHAKFKSIQPNGIVSLHAPECVPIVTCAEFKEFIGLNNNDNDLDELFNLWKLNCIVFGTLPFQTNVFIQPEDTGVIDQPEPITKRVKLSDVWKDKIKSKDLLEETSDPDKVCKACETYKKTIAFDPCGHRYYCDSCFSEMMEITSVKKVCPLCNAVFDNILRVID